MLKQVQQDNIGFILPFCHPELDSGSRFCLEKSSSKTPPLGKVLYPNILISVSIHLALQSEIGGLHIGVVY